VPRARKPHRRPSLWRRGASCVTVRGNGWPAQPPDASQLPGPDRALLAAGAFPEVSPLPFRCYPGAPQAGANSRPKVDVQAAELVNVLTMELCGTQPIYGSYVLCGRQGFKCPHVGTFDVAHCNLGGLDAGVAFASPPICEHCSHFGRLQRRDPFSRHCPEMQASLAMRDLVTGLGRVFFEVGCRFLSEIKPLFCGLISSCLMSP
jgi:hypothetical protein